MAQQRPLLLGGVGGRAPIIAAERKKYCIWALALVVPFLLLFCLFPSGSSFRPSNYQHRVVSQLQISASKPKSDHGRREKLSSKMDPLIVGGRARMQNEDSKSITQLGYRKTKLDRKKENSPQPKKTKLTHDTVTPERVSSFEKEKSKKAAAKDEDVPSFGKKSVDQIPISRKPIDDGEEYLSSFGKQGADRSPISSSKQSKYKPIIGVMRSVESMDDLDADRSRISKKSKQLEDLEEEFSSIGKRDGDQRYRSLKKQKQEDADSADLLFLEREQLQQKLDKKESQRKKTIQASDVLSEASSDSNEDPMIISEWSPDSRSTITHKKATKSSSPQQQDEDNLIYLTLQSRVISKAEPIIIRKKASAKCKLSKGKWIRDTKGPLYTNATCPWISHNEPNCNLIKKNNKAMYWRWKPDGCDLERFQAKAFLKLMDRKSLAFVGDKIAKAQMQSLLCLLAQVERPNLIYDDKANQSMSWHFSSSNFTLSMVWSPYLVQETAEEGYKKLRLDKLDTKWAELVPKLDVLVMGIGPLFIEPAAYVVKNQVMGCHACKTINGIDSNTTKEMSLYSAYRAAIRSSIMGVTALPGFNGKTVFLQAYGFEGKRYQNVSMKMNKVQEEEVEKAWERGIPNRSKVELLETALQSNPMSFSGTTNPMQAPKPAASYGCLPGLSDTWNQFLLHILNRLDSS